MQDSTFHKDNKTIMIRQGVVLTDLFACQHDYIAMQKIPGKVDGAGGTPVAQFHAKRQTGCLVRTGIQDYSWLESRSNRGRTETVEHIPAVKCGRFLFMLSSILRIDTGWDSSKSNTLRTSMGEILVIPKSENRAGMLLFS